MAAFATYLRVSTQRQGAQGLGIDAQRAMCKAFIDNHNGTMAREFMDVESGTHRDRKGLWQAIDYCQKNGCGLVIAKLDRLARDVEFTFKVINTGIDIHFTDMPVVNSMILGVFASVAQYEREMISSRTKQALAAKIARGEATGGAAPKWKETYNNKTMKQKQEENSQRGRTKNERNLQSRDKQAILKILRNVFPDYTNGDPTEWKWEYIGVKGDNKDRIWRLMRDYKEMDPTGKLFRKWDLEQPLVRINQQRLAAFIANIKKAVRKAAELGIKL